MSRQRQHVAFDNPEPIHLTCSIVADQALAVVDAFFRARPNIPVCRVCLARTLRVTIEDARQATNTLRLTRDDYCLVIGGQCGMCHRNAPATELAVSDSAAQEPVTRRAA